MSDADTAHLVALAGDSPARGPSDFPADGPIDATSPATPPMGATNALDHFFQSFCRLRPVTATFVGVHDYDHQLPDWSPEGVSESRREMSETRRELAAAGLGLLDEVAERERDWTDIDGALADAFLEIELAELDTTHSQRGNLSLAIGEAIFGVLVLMRGQFAAVEQRAVAVNSRLRAFPLFLVGVRRSLEEVTIPDAWRERMLHECDAGRRTLDEVQTWLDVEHVPASLRSDGRVGLAVARESLAWFSAFVRGLRAAPPSRYSAGPPTLELLLRRGHWLQESADQLRREAHEALDEELARLHEAISAAGPAGQSRAVTSGGGASIVDRITARAAQGDLVRVGFIAEAKSRIGQVAGVQCANRAAMLCSGTMIEGLPVYERGASSVLRELSPIERVAFHQSRVDVLVPAAVDLELHSGRIGFDGAVSLYAGRSGASASAARHAVTSLSMFPSSGSMAWLGSRTLHRLPPSVELAEARRQFASFGAIPVALAARLMFPQDDAG